MLTFAFGKDNGVMNRCLVLGRFKPQLLSPLNPFSSKAQQLVIGRSAGKLAIMAKNKKEKMDYESTKTIGELIVELLHSNEQLAVALRCAIQDGHLPLTAETIKAETEAKGDAEMEGENKTTPLEDWLDGQDVMQVLHISPRTLATLRANGTLPFSKLGGRCLYRKSDLEKVLDSHDTMVRLKDPKGYGHSRS